MKNVTKEEKMAYAEKTMVENTITKSLVEAWVENDKGKAIEALKKRMSDLRMDDQEVEVTKDYIIFIMDAFTDSLDEKGIEEFKEIRNKLMDDGEFIKKLEILEDDLYELEDKIRYEMD